MLVIGGLIMSHVSEMLRTLKRIEARMTLLNPLEGEAKAMKEDFTLRRHVEERAVQPDIWLHMTTQEIHDKKLLEKGREKEYREVRKLQRYRERARRS